MTTDATSSLGSTASRRPQHSRRHNAIVNSNVEANRTKLQEPEVFTSNVNVAKSEPPLTMPAFALGNPVVDVSLSSSTSSVVSGSASQHFQQTPAVDDSASAAVKPGSQAAKSKPFDTGPPAGRPTPVVQQLNHTDTVKWSQVAAWAAGDSAQAAALVEHLGPCIAESVASEADQDHALLRLEVQVARKKLAVSSQQMQEARGEAAALHLQLANLKASQQQIQANQEATIHKQQTQHTEADTKLKGQLQSAQDHIAQLEVQLATASEAASKTQLSQSLQLKKLSEQHSSMLSQLRRDHELQLKAATEHHEVMLQAHADRLEQQHQALAQQLKSEHTSELQSTRAELKAEHQQQMQTAVAQASSKYAGQVIQAQQQLQQVEAVLAVEKQKSVSLKAQLKREGKEGSAHLVELQSQHQELQQQLQQMQKVLEEERRKGSKSVREAKAAADAEALKAKQALTEAEQQLHEAVRQSEAEGHRSNVKLAQASRSLKAARQETADARKDAKEAKGSADWAKSQLDRTSSVVTALQQELQALKGRLQSEADLQKDSTAHQLQLAQQDLQTHRQQSASLHSVLRTISNVMPATPAQHDRWQTDDLQDDAHMPFEPQEVLQQVQSYMQHVEEQHERWQEEEEDHRHQLSALRLAHEAQAGRLSQEEERSKAAEGEVARQKACIGGLRADAARLGDALHQAKAQAQDARAGQGTAEAIAAACQRELSQVSSSLTGQLEAESMWQGRAQGLQQQLDQAMQDKLQLQQDMATAEAVVGDQQHRIRMLEQQLTEHASSAEQSRQSMEEANKGLVKQLEQATARALMAESSLQQLSSELSAQQSESQESSRLFHILYSGITNCTCSTTAAAETSPTALVPQPDCPIRTHDSPLPDQASVKQLLTHLQKILSAHEHQSRQLASASQQLEAYSADHAQATAVLQAAIRPPRNCSGDANQLISEGTSTPAELLELAESMAAALARHANQLTQTQTLVVHLQEQMSQAQEQKSSAMAELATCKEQLGVVAHTAHTAQMSLQQVQDASAAKIASLEASLGAVEQRVVQQQQVAQQAQSHLQAAEEARQQLTEQVSAISSDHAASRDAVNHLEGAKRLLQQQLSTLQSDAEAEHAKLKTHITQLTAQQSELSNQVSALTAHVHQLQQYHSTEALELTACNSGLMTQLSALQQQHAEAMSKAAAEASCPLEKQIAALKQQVRTLSQKLQTAEQRLRTCELSASEAESRAVRVEAVLKKTEDRRAGVEAERKRLQTVLRDVKAEASSWQQKYLTTQQALTAAQADAERSHKQAAAAAAVAQRHQQLLEQLSAAEAALADSHSSAQKLLLQLGESQASHRHTEQELRGMHARCQAAEVHLQHLQSASDSVLAELERTRRAVTASGLSCVQTTDSRETPGLQAVLPVPSGYGFDENTDPNSRSIRVPDTEDGKSERIRQLHLTLGALIDERDQLQDTLSSSASPELAQQLEDAQAELQVLRKYASTQTSSRNSLVEGLC